jgi:micrococcal nuclease
LIPIILAVLCLIRFAARHSQEPPSPATDMALREGGFEVVRVVDGDTLIVRPLDPEQRRRVDRRGVRLRLLGIDCPESVKPDHPVEPWGPESAAFTRDFVAGDRVQLRFDRRRIDRYQRYLAYAYVGDRMLNEALVRAGLARVSVFPGDSASMTRRLRKAEEEAREAKRGIWSNSR